MSDSEDVAIPQYAASFRRLLLSYRRLTSCDMPTWTKLSQVGLQTLADGGEVRMVVDSNGPRMEFIVKPAPKKRVRKKP